MSWAVVRFPGMFAASSLIVSSPPSGTIDDFDLVTLDNRLMLVGTPGRYNEACVWDPMVDQWTEHRLDGDPEMSEWGEPLSVPGERISCLDSGTVDGRPIAVTGAEDGAICVWDLSRRELLGEPLRDYSREVYGVRIAELNGRPVITCAAHNDAVRVWELLL
jgi:WD40 repeat protein